MNRFVTFIRMTLAFTIYAIFLNFSTAANTLDTATFVNIVTGLVAFLSPVILQKIVPSSVKGGTMMLIAIGASIVLALVGVTVSGGLQLDWKSAQQVGIAVASFMGLQQTFYGLFKDPLHLNQ